MFHIVSPSEKYYFNGPGETDTTHGFDITDTSYPPLTQNEADEMVDHEISGIDWDDNSIRAQYRVEPHNTTLVPFFTAFAKALSCMPSLKEAAL
jgi:hypothetical protein